MEQFIQINVRAGERWRHMNVKNAPHISCPIHLNVRLKSGFQEGHALIPDGKPAHESLTRGNNPSFSAKTGEETDHWAQTWLKRQKFDKTLKTTPLWCLRRDQKRTVNKWLWQYFGLLLKTHTAQVVTKMKVYACIKDMLWNFSIKENTRTKTSILYLQSHEMRALWESVQQLPQLQVPTSGAKLNQYEP